MGAVDHWVGSDGQSTSFSESAGEHADLREDNGSLLVPPCCFPLCCVQGRYHIHGLPDLRGIYAKELRQQELEFQEQLRELRSVMSRRDEERAVLLDRVQDVETLL